MKQILFKNTTTYSKKLYYKFNEFHNKKFGLNYEIYTLLISVIYIYYIITVFKNKIYFLGIFFIIILIFFILWRFLRPVFILKKEINSRKIAKQQKYTYCFYNFYFEVLHKNERTSLFYFKLRKVFETENEFYLYLDKTHALLLNKDSFTVGTSEEFSNFIKKKCWYKYKKESNKKDVIR